MAFKKIWAGATGAYDLASNWADVSVVSPAYQWTASGSGTNEYYLNVSGGGDPGFAAQPTAVYVNGSSASEGSAGTLAAGEWDYGDNDTLGYSTLYVRLSDGTDPDTKTNGYVAFEQIPQAGDDVVIQGTQAITSGLGQRLIELNSFRVESGYTGTIGTATGFLFIDLGDSDELYFAGTGNAFIDVKDAAISPTIEAGAATTELTLSGTALVNIDLRKGTLLLKNATVTGDIRQSFISGQTSDTVLTVDSSNTLTGVDLLKTGGTATIAAALATITNYAGTLTTRGAGAITTLTVPGGTVYPNSSGTITTANADGGIVDFTRSLVARTVTTLNWRSGEVKYDSDALTITNAIVTVGAVKLSAA